MRHVLFATLLGLLACVLALAIVLYLNQPVPPAHIIQFVYA